MPCGSSKKPLWPSAPARIAWPLRSPAFASLERAQFYKWLAWLTNTMQATLLVYFYPERWMNEGNTGGVAELKRHAERKLASLLDQLDAELARHAGPWFLGADYTALDAYVFTLCRWTRNFANESPARARAHLGPYLKRMLERPAVQRVIANEALAPPFV
jgi:glutathione S-transferase